jgi:hypothetical protein
VVTPGHPQRFPYVVSHEIFKSLAKKLLCQMRGSGVCDVVILPSSLDSRGRSEVSEGFDHLLNRSIGTFDEPNNANQYPRQGVALQIACLYERSCLGTPVRWLNGSINVVSRGPLGPLSKGR